MSQNKEDRDLKDSTALTISTNLQDSKDSQNSTNHHKTEFKEVVSNQIESSKIESNLDSAYKQFYDDAKAIFGSRIYSSYLYRFALGSDASCYRYIPKIVIRAINESEVMKVLALSRKFKLPLTFRAYGSSLSGQALSDSILVITTIGFKNIDIKKHSIKLGCGVIGSDANEALKNLGKKIGPDPATITMASIGGIVSNNSSGMCCGVRQNSYSTIKSIRVILGDGTLLDTGSKESVNSFLSSHKDLIDKILTLREEIIGDNELSNLIRKKYKIKNTTGYSLNALLDFENIIDILNHLFVGSEGTLGFISNVELESVDDERYKACGLLFYENMKEASKAIQILAKNDEIISSAEVMDYYSLKSVQNIDGLPSIIKEIRKDNACILIQTQSNDLSVLEKNLAKIQDSLKQTNLVFPPQYSKDESEFSKWWKIRKGLLPIASSNRREGTSVITEDVCFEIEKFAQGVEFIQNLFKKYDFENNGIIFGHALSGNIHFIITPNLNDSFERENFENLVSDMTKGVSNFGGSIKAEHGTGRMVAPFVEIEWGQKAYQINCKIKEIFDKENLLNPDVIITKDPNIHTKNLKEMTKIDDFIDKCMECGFCEKACPSNFLTLTPRQRIVSIREMQRLKNLNTQDSNALYKQMQKEYEYSGDITCATCSMCSTLCPLEIDTANIALNLRKQRQKDKNIAKFIIKNMGFFLKNARFGLRLINAFGVNFVSKTSLKMRKISSTIPFIPLNLPNANKFKINKSMDNANESTKTSANQAQNPTINYLNKIDTTDNLTINKAKSSKNEATSVVYFSTCINRTFAPSSNNLSLNSSSKNLKDMRSLQEIFLSIAKKANVNVIFPKNIDNLCCGKAFINYEDLMQENLKQVKNFLIESSLNGEFPIVLDHSACSMHLFKYLKDSELKIYDLAIYLQKELKDRLTFSPINEDIALYTMCALKKNSFSTDLLTLAKSCTKGKVVVDNSLYCCGFAGYKGFFTPELNNNALKNLESFYKDKNIKRGFSTSSTCEIGLNEYSSLSWQHIAYLVDEVSSSVES